MFEAGYENLLHISDTLSDLIVFTVITNLFEKPSDGSH